MLICFAYEWAFFKGASMEQDDFLARKEQILNRNSAKNFKEFMRNLVVTTLVCLENIVNRKESFLVIRLLLQM